MALQYAGTVVSEIGMAIQRTTAGDDLAKAHRESAIDAAERLLRIRMKWIGAGLAFGGFGIGAGMVGGDGGAAMGIIAALAAIMVFLTLILQDRQ